MKNLPVEKLYSEKNRETTKAVDKFLLEHFSSDQEIKYHIIRRQKTAPTKIKSFFVRIGFEIGNTKNQNDWQTIIPLCAMVELLNIGNYLIERSIDYNQKEDYKLGSEIRKIVLSSKFLEPHEKDKLNLMIDGINEYLKTDNEILIWDKPINKSSFSKVYQEKCFGVGGQYYGHCLDLGYLKSKNQDEVVKKHLIKIGEIFGTYYQMVHEVADLLPEKLKRFPEDFKYYQKQYNSVRKHKLTLPIYFALYEWKNFDKKEFLKAVEEKNYNLITQIFLKEKIIKKCKTYIRKSMKEVESEFKFLPDSIWRSVLKVGVNAVNSNTFWKHFKKLYAEVA